MSRNSFNNRNFPSNQVFCLKKIDHFSSLQISCPIKVLHAWQDAEIPFEQSLKLQEMVQSPDFDIIFRKDGNHRLMKSRDLTLLTYTIHSLLNELEMQSKL